MNVISCPNFILDESESWWVCAVEEMFGSSMTAATSTVLQTELENCQELLQMEPNNKCKWNPSIAATTGEWSFGHCSGPEWLYLRIFFNMVSGQYREGGAIKMGLKLQNARQNII